MNYWDDPKFPRFGAGRIDTFNSVKVLSGFDMGAGRLRRYQRFPPRCGTSRPRRVDSLHWDGNNKKMRRSGTSLLRSGSGCRRPTARTRTFARRSTSRAWRGSRSGSSTSNRRSSRSRRSTSRNCRAGRNRCSAPRTARSCHGQSEAEPVRGQDRAGDSGHRPAVGNRPRAARLVHAGTVRSR